MKNKEDPESSGTSSEKTTLERKKYIYIPRRINPTRKCKIGKVRPHIELLTFFLPFLLFIYLFIFAFVVVVVVFFFIHNAF